ncbi:hypothetical protein [Pseudogulbenkiania sp. MAI-1]|uniref:hypothetical protein n=1 Tax=Pseudogulbenkiania sp. MAI-1 TaxID=990370 RepID=UPI0004A4B97B|nr:hypothetical protein [Pseudogulbenkiania sp. MAI-1]
MLDLKDWLIVGAVSGAVVAGYGFGSSHTASVYKAHLATQAENHARDLNAVSDAKAAELAGALVEQQKLADQAHKLGWELIQTRARLADTQSQLKQRIPDAIRTDGPHWTGLGPDSLRLYQSALGYTPSDPGVPAADAGNADQAGQAAGTDEGLPPEDLLAHSADYGEWCQRLDAQLDTLINLHRKDGDGPL